MAELSRGQILKDPEVFGTTTSGAKIRLRDGDESTYIDLKVPDTVTTSYTFTLPPDDGTVDQVLRTDGNGATSWVTVSASPGGSNTQLQYNNSGAFAGATGLTTDGSNLQIGATGELRLADTDSSNYVAFKSPGTVAANRVYTLPATIGTVGQVLKIASGATSTAATLEWSDDLQGGAGTSPGGSNTQVQFNDGGVFGGDADFTYDKAFNTLSVGIINLSSIGNLRINNSIVLTQTTLGSSVVNSSLTSVGTLSALQVALFSFSGNVITTTGSNTNLDINPSGTGSIRARNATEIRFMDSDNTNYGGIVAPASITSDYTITLPTAGGEANDILQFDGSQNASFVSNTRTLNFVIDGGGSAITTGIKGHVVLDGDYTITGWTIIADQSGSIVVDVNRATYTNFPTTSSIAGSELPTLSSAQKNEDLALTTWTTTLSARDVLEFQVDSASTVTRVTVALRLVPR